MPQPKRTKRVIKFGRPVELVVHGELITVIVHQPFYRGADMELEVIEGPLPKVGPKVRAIPFNGVVSRNGRRQ